MATNKKKSASAVEKLIGALTLIDTAKNSLISKDRSIIEEIKKSTKDFPESAMANAVDGMDVVNSWTPEFAKDHPDLAAALGVAVDILDPVAAVPGVAAGKTAGKVAKSAKALDLILNPGAAGMKVAGKALTNKATTGYIKKTITSSGVKKGTKSLSDEATKLAEYARKNGYSGDLLDAKKLRDIMEGPLVDGKRSGGVKGTLGKKVEEVITAARDAGVPKVDRTKIEESLVQKVKSANKDLEKWGSRDKDAIRAKIQEGLKSRKVEKTTIPGFKTEPKLSTEMDVDSFNSKIAALQKELDSAKDLNKTRKVQAAERAAAEETAAKQSKADLEAFNKSKQDILASQDKELSSKRLEIAKKNEAITKQNKSIDEEIAAIKARNASLETPVEILQPFKVDPGADAITKAEMELYNDRAKKSIKDYIAQGKMEKVSPEKLAEMDTKKQPLVPQVSDLSVNSLDDLPPPVPRVPEVPPAIPADATSSRSIEDILAEIQDTQNLKAGITGANASVKDANKAAVKNAKKMSFGPETVVKETPVVSDVKELWNLRRDMANQLSELNVNQSPTDIQAENAKIIREAMLEVEKAIDDSLSTIQGNGAQSMKDAYKAAKTDYHEAENFTRYLNQLENYQNKSHMQVPTNRGFIMRNIETVAGPDMQLRAGSVMQNEGFSRGTMGAAKELSQKVASPSDMEYQDQGSDVVTPDAVDMSKLEPVGREPQSIEQKMDETINPRPIKYNPYVNEEVLNTPLPRDTERLMQNKDVLRAKMSQVAPQYLPVLDDMLQHDPEGFRKGVPKLALLHPSLFERDDYNMFDGKIEDPQMQQKFLADLYRDEGMSSIEKAKLAMKISRKERI